MIRGYFAAHAMLNGTMLVLQPARAYDGDDTFGTWNPDVCAAHGTQNHLNKVLLMT